MEAILLRWLWAGFMRQVARVASHIERGVAAALVRNMQAGLVALQAKIFLLVAGLGLQQVDSCCRWNARRGTSGNRAPPADAPFP